jgi:hypothetical protein
MQWETHRARAATATTARNAAATAALPGVFPDKQQQRSEEVLWLH